jgi:hypothetical protein
MVEGYGYVSASRYFLPSACGCPYQLPLPIRFKEPAGEATLRVDGVLLLKEGVNPRISLP